MYLAKRLAWLALAGVALLVALFGLFRLMIEVGASPLRYVVQDAGVLAAGVLGMVLCWWQGRKLQLTHEAAQAAPAAFTDAWLEASAAPWKQVLALLFFALLAVACWLMYLDSGDPRGLLLTPLMAAAVVLLGLHAAALYRNGRPTLRLDAQGLDHAFFGLIPWTEVRRIHFQTIALRGPVKAKSLVIDVADTAPYLARRPWIAQLISGRLHAQAPLEIGLTPLDKDPALVANAAITLWTRARLAGDPDQALSVDAEFAAVGKALEDLNAIADHLPEQELLARLQAIEARLQVATERRAQGG